MIAVARIMGALYVVLGCLAAVVFAISMSQTPATETVKADYYLTMIVASLGCIAVGGLIGAVGEIGSLVRKIANRPAPAPVVVERPAEPAEWVVVGRDNKGKDRHVRVRAASREDAFLAATMQGVTQAHSIEMA